MPTGPELAFLIQANGVFLSIIPMLAHTHITRLDLDRNGSHLGYQHGHSAGQVI